MNNNKHYAAAISAFVVWGFFSLPLRALNEYTAGEILYFRIACSVLILLIIIVGFRKTEIKQDAQRLKEFPSRERNQIIALTLAGALLLIVNWLIFIYVINHINIKTASFSYFICPVLTAVLGNFILKERLTALQWSAVALCVISCVLLGLNSVLELGYSFAVAISYALYLVSQRKNYGFDSVNRIGRSNAIRVDRAYGFISLAGKCRTGNIFLLRNDRDCSRSVYGIAVVFEFICAEPD